MQPRCIPTSTVGRSKALHLETEPTFTSWKDELVSIQLGDSLRFYGEWERPDVIVSDGGYGVLGFEGDTSDHLDLPQWYEPHIRAWSTAAKANSTLWFWNSEIGWAVVHPILEACGWRYISCNIWNKGKGHIAGNVNTQRIRRFPVVTEVCAQYVFEPLIKGMNLKQWLLTEWKRSKLPLKRANEACGVADAAVRKYLDQGHLWYFPPPAMFAKLAAYANKHGDSHGRPYFSIDGKTILDESTWASMRSKFNCPHGITNVWDRNALRDGERIKAPSGKAVHLNQKPLDLMRTIIEATSDENDVIWEPFGGLFTALVAARRLKRRGYGAEIDWTYFYYGAGRLRAEASQLSLS